MSPIEHVATSIVSPRSHLGENVKPVLEPLSYPSSVQRRMIIWRYVVVIGLYHVVALLAFIPWYFSWTGLILCLAGTYVFGTLGINLCFHRVLTHQGLVLPKWLEHTFAILGVCCMQDTPARWVAIHRMHHQHSDDQPDPHSPLVTLLWGHMGWLFVENDAINTASSLERYARDVLKDPFYFYFERGFKWVWVNLIQGMIYFAAGLLIGWLTTSSAVVALQMGASLLLWGVIVRTVLVWHITWSVNSLAHIWGYKNYELVDNSRNNWFVALISNGEGWHNNHHADQRCAAHGHRWWEFDVTWLTVRFLELIGLARDISRPRQSSPKASSDMRRHAADEPTLVSKG